MDTEPMVPIGFDIAWTTMVAVWAILTITALVPVLRPDHDRWGGFLCFRQEPCLFEILSGSGTLDLGAGWWGTSPGSISPHHFPSSEPSCVKPAGRRLRNVDGCDARCDERAAGVYDDDDNLPGPGRKDRFRVFDRHLGGAGGSARQVQPPHFGQW